jgi:acyl-CoA dehydrogenase
MQGPNNILGLLFQSTPVGKTVEGADIMTRTFQINGQGAVRCHPYSYPMTLALENNDVRAFRKNLFGWIGHAILGFCRTRFHSLTRGRFIKLPPHRTVDPELKSHMRRLGWAAARFGLLSDIALLLIRGNLKKEGRLNGRYADAFAGIWFALAAIARFHAEGRRREDLPLVKAAVEHCLHEVQKAYEGIYHNFKAPVVGVVMRTVLLHWMRMNPLSLGPSDRQSHEAALTIQSYNDQFLRLADGVYLPAEDKPALGRLLKAFRLRTEAEALFARITAAQKRRELPRGEVTAAMADTAAGAGVLTAAEAQQVKEAVEACFEACKVDVFTDEQYYRDEDAATTAA